MNSARDVRFYWNIQENILDAAIQATTDGWLAVGIKSNKCCTLERTNKNVGFATQQNMVSETDLGDYEGTDVILGWVGTDCEGGCVKDYWIDQYAQPSLDPQQDATLLSATYESGGINICFLTLLNSVVTAFEFRRTIGSDNVKDRVPDNVNNLNWALHSTTDPFDSSGSSFPQHTHKSSTTWNFKNSVGTCIPINLFLIHFIIGNCKEAKIVATTGVVTTGTTGTTGTSGSTGTTGEVTTGQVTTGEVTTGTTGVQGPIPTLEGALL